MGRTDDGTITIDTAAPRRAWAGVTFRLINGWLLFCVLIVAIKLLLLWLDPTPKLYMGDSGSYIRTALIGSIPRDRSYFYGYLVRVFAVWPHGFVPLLVAQALASGATAIVFADLQPVLQNVEQAFLFLWINLCAGSVPACLGAVRDDRDLQPPCLRGGSLLVAGLFARSAPVATRNRPDTLGSADWL